MNAHSLDVDVAIVGSGFAGALTALALRRRGMRVALLERGCHPRFAIGESSTPLANLLIEHIADRYDLPRIRAFSKWGTWQRERPDVAAGLKRGFTFWFHRAGERFSDNRDHSRQLVVAASPHDDIGDTHWYRPDFDHALVREAEAEGAVYLDQTRLERFRDTGMGVELSGTRSGRELQVSARFVIDASGPRGFLHKALALHDAPMQWLPPTQALYTHFDGVEQWEHVTALGETPPFPVDAAALHHVFDGGWMWVLRFNNGMTSAGVALTDRVAAGFRAEEGPSAWDRVLASLPSVQDQFREARPLLPFVHAPRLAFRSREVCGPRWALLPSAAGVIDPLLSTGFPLTLLGILRLLDVLETSAEGPEREAGLGAYARATHDELEAAEQLVAALYASMTDPPLFKRLTLLYFAAASYAETAWRLGRRELAPGFLLHAHPAFGPELRACSESALRTMDGIAREELLTRIDRAILPFDIAGLLDRSRRDWYPVLAEDLVTNASKLHASSVEIERLLERCGFTARGPARRV
ncbi:MAG: FAD-dependent oxidoreductase [Acidobacteriota bacterium]